MKQLSRSWARASILLAGLFCLLAALACLLDQVWLMIPGSVALTGAFLIKLLVLACPHCGYRGAPPQWRQNRTIHCPRCGNSFEYDR